MKDALPTFNRVPITEVLPLIINAVISSGGKVSSFGVEAVPAKVHNKSSDFRTSYIASSALISKFKAAHETAFFRQPCQTESTQSGSNFSKESMQASSDNKTLSQKRKIGGTSSGESSSMNDSTDGDSSIEEDLHNANETDSSSSYSGGLEKQLSRTENCDWRNKYYENSPLDQEKSFEPTKDILPSNSTNLNDVNLNKEFKIDDVSTAGLFDLTAFLIHVIPTQNENVLRISDGSQLDMIPLQLNSEEAEIVSGCIDVLVRNEKLMEMGQKRKDSTPGKYINVEYEKYKRGDSQGDSMELVDSSGEKVDGFKLVIKDENGKGTIAEILEEDDERINPIEERLHHEENQNKEVGTERQSEDDLVLNGANKYGVVYH